MPKTAKISRENRESICGKLEWEGGFEYFIAGSDFRDIKDARFHKLRKEFVRAYRALDAYLEYPAYLDSLGSEE
jgi:hypothetical protein